MLDKNKLVTLVDIIDKREDDILLPNSFMVRPISLSKEELETLEKDMNRYSFRVRNTSIDKDGREHHFKYDEDLSTLSDHLKPLYVIKNSHLFGVVLSLIFNGEERQCVFLTNGEIFGENFSGHKNDIEEDISTYNLGYK